MLCCTPARTLDNIQGASWGISGVLSKFKHESKQAILQIMATDPGASSGESLVKLYGRTQLNLSHN